MHLRIEFEAGEPPKDHPFLRVTVILHISQHVVKSVGLTPISDLTQFRDLCHLHVVAVIFIEGNYERISWTALSKSFQEACNPLESSSGHLLDVTPHGTHQKAIGWVGRLRCGS